MRFITLFIVTIALAVTALAQAPLKTLATVSGRSFTAKDLSPKVTEAWLKMPTVLANARVTLLDKQVEDVLLDIEAKSKAMTANQLVTQEVVKKVPDPTAAEIKKIYDANKSQLGNTTLADIRPQIIDFLRDEPEKKAFDAYIKSLRTKHKIIPIKDINSKSLTNLDVIVKVGDRDITFAQFMRANGLALYEFEANIFDAMKNSLEQVVDAALYASEAQSLGILTSEYIAREITDKAKTYSQEETARIQTDIRKKLYPKYRVRFFVNEPKPFIQNVSADDDPFFGKANASVTVVMFTDYQCPTCATVYPILKKLVEGYGDKVRLVVRDFPLEQIHKNAFQAALAANAANAQGKFFEYKELLYKNQNSLDTESLKKYASNIGLKIKKFEKDLEDKKLAAEIRRDIADGKRYGVGGTPSIFVNGYKIRGLSTISFRKAIERALGK